MSDVIWTILIAVLISLPLLVVYNVRLRSKRVSKPFPFLDLPTELRDMVYEHLVDGGVTYPATKLPAKTVSTLEWLLFSSKRTPPRSDSNWIMLANRQIHREFSDVLCKKAKFTLSVDQWTLKNDHLWEIDPNVLRNIKKCEVRMITTSNMLGAVDPRHMPRHWPLCDRVCDALSTCNKLENLSLHVRAIGDPLWNPLWVWYHASQSFKTAKFDKFSSITFSLDSPSPGENHLARNKDGVWEWCCAAGHPVMPDISRWQPIREFCHSLYGDCQECISEHESEHEHEQIHEVAA